MYTIARVERAHRYFLACPCGKSRTAGGEIATNFPTREYEPKRDGAAACANCDDYGWTPFTLPSRSAD